MLYRKTVIAEIKKDHGLVIDEEGHFHRIKLKKGMRIGDRIAYRSADRYRLVDQKKRLALPEWAPAAFAAGAIFLFAGMCLPAVSEVFDPPVADVLDPGLPTTETGHSITITVGEEDD